MSLARVDLNAPAELLASLSGAVLVIHGAGPFHRTAAPVRSLCLELGIDYLDIDDDVESTLEAIALHDRAGPCLRRRTVAWNGVLGRKIGVHEADLTD